MNHTYIGKDMPIENAAAKAMGRLVYCGDMSLPHMAYMKLVLSPVAHGIVGAIHTEKAMAIPGVLAVLTPDNTPAITYDRGRVLANQQAPAQETLFSRHVRFAGDRVAAVVAETPAAALEAAALVEVQIDPLPAAFTPEDALDLEQPIHDKDSVITLPTASCGDFDGEAGELFTHQTSTQRITHVAMENHCALADYDPATRRMTIWTPTQSVFGVRSVVCTVLGLPMNRVRVIKTPMGGSFGCKQEMILEPLAACAAQMLGRPVMLQFDRREVILCTVLKHPLASRVQAKIDAAHKVKGLRIDVTLDAGAYQSVSPDYAETMAKKFSWVYDIPSIEYRARSVCTNTPVSGSYRGWGGPEVALILENTMNAYAKKQGLDPIDFRLKNILPPFSQGKFISYNLGSLPFREALQAGRARFQWDARKQALASQDRAGRYLKGIGMALSTHTSGYFPRRLDWGRVILKMEEDGTVQINLCVHDHGCGEVTALRSIAAEELRLSPDKIELQEGDTAYNALDNGCYTSRSVYVLGKAVQEAAQSLLKELYRYGACLLQAPPEALSHGDGRVFVREEPSRACTYSDIAYYCADHGAGALMIDHNHIPESNPGPVAAHFCQVEVDRLTGQCQVTDYLAVHDVGQAINPASCRSQVASALQQGMGFVFCEKIQLDEKTGRVKNADLQRYHVVRAAELPPLDILFIEQPDEKGPYGAKSLGEACALPVAPALVAAVNDALDMDLTQLPLTPERILKALSERK